MDSVLADHLRAAIPEPLKATLTFLEKVTLHPDQLSSDDAAQARASGATDQQLESALAVCAVFNIYDRLADATGFALPASHELDRKLLAHLGYPP